MYQLLNRSGRAIDGLQVSYWNTLFRSLALGMLGIYVPVFVYLKGVEGGDWIMGVRWLMVYVILLRLVTMLSLFVVVKFIDKNGFRWSVLMASALSVMAYLSFIFADYDWRWLVLAALLMGFEVAFYWVPRLSMNVSDGHKDRIGSEIGTRELIGRGVSVLGPFVGGVVISVWGFEVLFGLGIVMMFLSSLPLFFMEKHKHEDGVSVGGFWKFLKEEKIASMSFFGHGMTEMAMGWVWPIFVFVVVGGFRELGAVTSGVLVVSMLGVFVVSRSFDRLRSLGGDRDEKMFELMSVFTALFGFLRGFAQSIWGVFGLDALFQTSLPGLTIPLYGYIYTMAARRGIVKTMAYREMVYSSGVIMMAVLAICLIVLPWGWQVVFGLGSLGVLLNIPMKKESNR